MVRIINTRIVRRYCWNSLLLLFLGIAEILRFVGQKIDIETGVVMITILGLGIPGIVRIGKILCFVGQKVDMGTRVAILTTLGLDIPGFIETCQDGRLATPSMWGDFRTLIYVIASALVFFSQSHLMTGAACACATMEILIDIYLQLPQEYVFTGVPLLFIFVTVAILYGYTPNRAY